MSKFNLFSRATALTAVLFLSACATMITPTELSKVKFSLDRVSAVQLAGINLMEIDTLDELNMFQIARASMAVSRQSLPLDLTLHLKSENPLANQVAARLIRMDWTLVLDGRDTISGSMEKNIQMAAGESQDIPLNLSLNMFEFFDEKSALDMLDLALAFAAEDGMMPQGVALKIRPTIDTMFGPITYGSPLLIESRSESKGQRQVF
ncbi:hypothetical protein MMIC_P1275 [Mariprofundus micogutta]|uniref:Late embryogenesis abundant protein n=1 Tax=Mariprofundus micogutta TaxID=1921010 RepID=A0A1L8CN21_9PROT|nr:hypothetical protein [Mariprofundus micogutta]GAV20310.1 hypothetical protein MMIC_P1275 [Mariprofundus micogutta]